MFNVGATALTINNIQRISGSSDFTITGPSFPITIAAGEEVDWTITLTATSSSTNPESAVFQIDSNDSFKPTQQITYTATVGAPNSNTVIASGGGLRRRLRGFRALIERTKSFLGARGNGRVFVNLDAVTYWSLLRHVKLLAGNSSSGIMETSSFGLPTVNIGIRQQGRERAKNVLDAPADTAAILTAIRTAGHPDFRASLGGMTNPYGDGTASERIAEVLMGVSLGQKLLLKRAVPLATEALSAVPFDCK